jgi:translocation and assembly module TamB
MGRRQLVVLLSAITMLLIGAGIVGGLVAATQSAGGRAWIGRQLSKQLARAVKGKLYVGKLSGSLLTDFAVDSVAIIGPDDSVFIATGPLHVSYDPRDLIDGRIIVRSLELQHPFVVFRKENDGRWNYKKIFPPAGGEPGEPGESAGRSEPGGRIGRVGPEASRDAFVALVQFRNVRIRELHFQLTLPWAPDDSLKGARRDSAIVRNLADTTQEIRAVAVKGRRGYQRTTRFTQGNFTFSRVRFRQPNRTGRQFDITRMDVNVSSPPFHVRNMRGGVLWRGDSIWLGLPHLELPGSVASATGRLDWGDNKALAWDVRILSDTMSLHDVSFITPAIPKTGGGSVALRIKTDRDPRLLDYIVTKMNLRTTASHLSGAMTFAVGGPVLIIRDIDMRLDPLDFAYFEMLNGGPLAQPWHGAFTGTLRGRGGPVNHLMIDEARLSYADHNVPGAMSAFVGRGEVDFLSPSDPSFHDFHVDLTRFDLRTPQFLSEHFPRMSGIASGEATLDSAWTDVRIRDADLTLRGDDSLPPSRFKGDARLTQGGDNLSFDVAVAALPISFTTLSVTYPNLRLPVRGEYTGPIRAHGDITDFSATTDLVGDGGRLQLEGQFDLATPGYRAEARGSVAALDLHQALLRRGAPVTNLNGRFVTALEFDSLPNMLGEAQLSVDRSVVDGVRLYAGSQVSLRFAGGAMEVDSMRVETAAGSLTAHGGIGLSTDRRDSLQFRLAVDSLGGLRRYLVKAHAPADSAVPGDTAAARAAALADSLGGSFTATGSIAGNVARFTLRASGDAQTLRMGDVTARAASFTAAVALLPDSAAGIVSISADTLHVGGLSYVRVAARDSLFARDHQRLTLSAKSQLDSARVVADLRLRGDTASIRVDSMSVVTPTDSWLLRRRATVSIVKTTFSFDTLVLAGRTGGALAVSGGTQADSAVSLAIRADSVPLADIGEMIQVAAPFEGTASLRGVLSGRRESPVFKFDGSVRHGQVLGLRLDELQATGSYADRRLTTTLVYSRLGLPALHGSAVLPIDLGLHPAGPRLIEAPIVASVHTDSGGMAILEALSKSVTKASGALALDLGIAGTWQHPLLTGALTVHDGELSLEPLGNVKLTALEANVAFKGDSIVGKVSARSGKTKPATGELSGVVAIRDIQKPAFNLTFSAQNFNVIDRARFATLDLTGTLGLAGSTDAATLTGALTADRGNISIPDLFAKHVISLDDPELYRVVDTSALTDRHILPTPPSALMDHLTLENVTVQMGREVWLRSSEANINLGGQVTIQSGRSQRGSTAGRMQLTLDGALQTVRGTYKLNLGPVVRTFQVENGDVRFFRDDDLNGTLNVNGLYTVRQSSQQGARPDVHVRVHLSGTLLAPHMELSNADSSRGTPLTQADLVSYLVTGQPSNQIGGPTGDYTSTALNTAVSYGFSQFTAGYTGGLCDDAQLSTAGLDEYQGQRFRDVGGGILSGTQFNCARQLGDKFFLRLDYGLCQVGQIVGGGSGTSDPLTFADEIGVKLDYEISNKVTLSFGIEPPTAAVLCTRDASARGFAPTPRQFGMDLFRLWRF